jgi:hypothetical protein
VAKVATLSRRFGRPSAVRVYWLARCEGFRLTCGDGTSGVVEEVLLDASNTEAEALVVRVHGLRHRSVVVPAERVDAVAPFEEILLGAEVAPAHRRTRRRTSRRIGRLVGRAASAGGRGGLLVGRTASTGGRGAIALLLRMARSAQVALAWATRQTRIVVPWLARISWLGAVAAAGAIRAAHAHAAPHVAAAARTGRQRTRVGAGALALVSARAARRLQAAVLVRLSGRWNSRRS